MMNGDTNEGDFLHKEYPKQFARTEFWKQIKRTVGGEPVSEEDIDAIVDQIVRHLDLDSNDHLLDLGCGNGALAGRLFSRLKKYTGVDFSEYLLTVAAEFFQPHDGVQYIQSDIRAVQGYLPAAAAASKVLIYGCISYLNKDDVRQLLTDLNEQLVGLSRVFIGNVADLNRADGFFKARNISEYRLDDPKSAIGVWWDPDEFLQLANEIGFKASCVSMPNEFYGSRYRFDVLLESDRG